MLLLGLQTGVQAASQLLLLPCCCLVHGIASTPHGPALLLLRSTSATLFRVNSAARMHPFDKYACYAPLCSAYFANHAYFRLKLDPQVCSGPAEAGLLWMLWACKLPPASMVHGP